MIKKIFFFRFLDLYVDTSDFRFLDPTGTSTCTGSSTVFNGM